MHHLAPQVLPQYTLASLNRLPNGNLNAMPTPPVTTRKRKRPQQFSVSYSEVQEVDSAGRLREVIVIDDTPPPSTISPATTHTQLYSASYQPPVYSAPIRTRARAAAEAQALSASTSSATIMLPVAKKRKREYGDDTGVAPKKTQTLNGAGAHKPWATGSGASSKDVRHIASSTLEHD